MGPLFGPRNFSHLQIIGAASRLSFGGGATFSLAVQFCPQPSTLPGTHGGPSAAAAPGTAADSSAGGRPGILLSKFHSGLRGEYRHPNPNPNPNPNPILSLTLTLTLTLFYP